MALHSLETREMDGVCGGWWDAYVPTIRRFRTII